LVRSARADWEYHWRGSRPIQTLSPKLCLLRDTKHHLSANKREEFFPAHEIIEELGSFLESAPKLDYITFSGAGEPTLYSRIDDIIDHIKERYPQYKLALLTNGILLSDDEVLASIVKCDLILPSLDAASQEVFERVNRPMDGIKVEDQIEGLVRLREIYDGEIHLEVSSFRRSQTLLLNWKSSGMQ